MSFLFGLFFIGFGVLLIAFPNLVAYIIGAFFMIVGINIFIGAFLLRKFKSKTKKGNVVEVAGYKVYKE